MVFAEMKTEENKKKSIGGKRSTLGDVSWSSVKMQEDTSENEESATGTKKVVGRSTSGGSFLKQLLDRWEEPPKQQDKVSPQSHSILFQD